MTIDEFLMLRVRAMIEAEVALARELVPA